ncbi:MAG: DegT/DnrJ/EryC1/StrS family aminotransferase [Pirellulales bacterium]
MSHDVPAILGGSPRFERPIPFVRPTLPSFDQVADELRSIISSGLLTKGSRLRQFEEAVAAHLGVQHAVAVSSCTTGLMLSYQGLGLTGEVIVPSFTFMATVSALVWNRLTPVYVDVDFDSTNIDPAVIERAITPRTSAIVGVHNFGNPAPIAELEEIARRHKLKLVFDAAHGFGTLYQGQPVGGQGDAHCFSMSPTKLLVAGEGGIVSTNDDALAQHIRLGREYGNDGTYDSAFAGMNARMPEISALMGLHGLPLLEGTARFRNEVAKKYRAGLESLPGLHFQEIRPGDRSSYKDFSIVVEADAFGLTRDELALALRADNVDTRKYYDPPAHRQTAYQHFTQPGQQLPNTEALATGSLSLPIGAQVDDQVIAGVCGAVASIQAHRSEVRQRLAGPVPAAAGA